MNKHICYLDLFSGLGAFAKGLQNAGFVFDQHYFSEIDPIAIANYKYNFKNANYVGAIEKIKSIKKPDLITFGSPCQDVSISGERRGINGHRSNLFFEAIEIIDRYQPSCFVFENVKGIFSSNQGKDFQIVLRAIADLGLYECQWQLINTAWFLPQNRERIYLVGCLRKESGKQVFPLNFPYETTRNEKKGIVLLANTEKGVRSQSGRVYSRNGISPALMAQCDFGHGYLEDNGRVRRLTPIEGERLQGLPDNWTQYGVFGTQRQILTDAQRRVLIGNAVSCPIITEIGKAILR